MLDGIEGVMNLAAASGEVLATTSDIVTDALTAFGLTAKDSGHFADILAAASFNANTNVSMMGETFKYCAPIAGALGFSAEDTAEAIGDVTIATTNADGSMRSLSDILGDCRTAFGSLTESEKAQTAESLVGKNAMSGFPFCLISRPISWKSNRRSSRSIFITSPNVILYFGCWYLNGFEFRVTTYLISCRMVEIMDLLR